MATTILRKNIPNLIYLPRFAQSVDGLLSGEKSGKKYEQTLLPSWCTISFFEENICSKVWDEVKYCSEKCRRNRGSGKSITNEPNLQNQNNFNLIPRKMHQDRSTASKAFISSGIILSAVLTENKCNGAAAFASNYESRPTVDEVQVSKIGRHNFDFWLIISLIDPAWQFS